jgi:hypothetical protein
VAVSRLTLREHRARLYLCAAVITLSAFGSRAANAQFVVSNNNDSGSGSLRQAILDADAAGAPSGVPGATQTITFNAGVGTITLGSPHLKTGRPAALWVGSVVRHGELPRERFSPLRRSGHRHSQPPMGDVYFGRRGDLCISHRRYPAAP